MPVITVVNPKGGSGCSTVALILGTQLAAGGESATILDCDPNQPLVHWRGGGSASRVRITGNITQNDVIAEIRRERPLSDVVIVDSEGIASRKASLAISQADLVLIPTQASFLDAAQGARVVQLVMALEQAQERQIPLRILLTRTSPQIPTRNEKLIINELGRAGIPMLENHLNERAAFKSVFTYRKAIEELEPTFVNGIDGARLNAVRLVEEIVDVLSEFAHLRAYP